MKKKTIKNIKKENYLFGDNYELIFINEAIYNSINCNIICGNNCLIDCVNNYNITSGSDCMVDCGRDCNITCKGNCEIICECFCNITCGNNCEIKCWGGCNITCENNCSIDCGDFCNITCRNNCKVILSENCYIKAGLETQLKTFHNVLKTISKGEEFIWWYIDGLGDLINTFEDVEWKEENVDKWNKFYGFVHNELDSATLF